MVINCAAAFCHNSSADKRKSVSFFRFPNDVQQSNKWSLLIGRHDLLDGKVNSQRVCSDHFDESSITSTSMGTYARLVSGAMPMKVLQTSRCDNIQLDKSNVVTSKNSTPVNNVEPSNCTCLSTSSTQSHLQLLAQMFQLISTNTSNIRGCESIDSVDNRKIKFSRLSNVEPCSIRWVKAVNRGNHVSTNNMMNHNVHLSKGVSEDKDNLPKLTCKTVPSVSNLGNIDQNIEPKINVKNSNPKSSQISDRKSNILSDHTYMSSGNVKFQKMSHKSNLKSSPKRLKKRHGTLSDHSYVLKHPPPSTSHEMSSGKDVQNFKLNDKVGNEPCIIDSTEPDNKPTSKSTNQSTKRLLNRPPPSTSNEMSSGKGVQNFKLNNEVGNEPCMIDSIEPNNKPTNKSTNQSTLRLLKRPPPSTLNEMSSGKGRVQNFKLNNEVVNEPCIIDSTEPDNKPTSKSTNQSTKRLLNRPPPSTLNEMSSGKGRVQNFKLNDEVGNEPCIIDSTKPDNKPRSKSTNQSTKRLLKRPPPSTSNEMSSGNGSVQNFKLNDEVGNGPCIIDSTKPDNKPMSKSTNQSTKRFKIPNLKRILNSNSVVSERDWKKIVTAQSSTISDLRKKVKSLQQKIRRHNVKFEALKMEPSERRLKPNSVPVKLLDSASVNFSHDHCNDTVEMEPSERRLKQNSVPVKLLDSASVNFSHDHCNDTVEMEPSERRLKQNSVPVKLLDSASVNFSHDHCNDTVEMEPSERRLKPNSVPVKLLNSAFVNFSHDHCHDTVEMELSERRLKPNSVPVKLLDSASVNFSHDHCNDTVEMELSERRLKPNSVPVKLLDSASVNFSHDHCNDTVESKTDLPAEISGINHIDNFKTGGLNNACHDHNYFKVGMSKPSVQIDSCSCHFMSVIMFQK